RLREGPRDSLLAWYELDGSLSDITGNYRHGRIRKGDPSWEDGKIGKSAGFDGQTQVSFGNLGVGGDKPFSMSLWLAADGARRNPVFTKLTPDGRGFEVYLDDYGLTDIQQRSPRVFVRLGGADGKAIEISARDRLIAGEFYQVSLNYDGSGKAAGLELWIDGKRAQTDVLHDALAGAVSNDAPLEIGDEQFGPRFRGQIDDLRLYSRTLKPAEIEILAHDEPLRALLAKLPSNRSKDEKEALRDYYLSK